MQIRPTRMLEDLELKALDSVAELPRATGVPRPTLHCLLPSVGARLLRTGKAAYVPLSEVALRIAAL
jgi:hypothetical protein